MNCQECRMLLEQFLDGALKGCVQRKVSLHLSRCTECRSYFERRRKGHADAYHAVNAALAGECPPPGFTERFLARRGAASQPGRRFLGVFRRIAAVLAAMLLFAGLSYAAITVITEADGGNVAGDGQTEATGSVGNVLTSVAVSAAEDADAAEAATGDGNADTGVTTGDADPAGATSLTETAGNDLTGNAGSTVAVLSAVVMATVDAVSASACTNALTASDFSKKDSFVNAGCWSNIVTGVRGNDGDPLDAQWDYLVNGGRYCCSPTGSSEPVVFPGRSLAVGDSSSKGNLRTYCMRDAELVFNSPGLFLVNGTLHVERMANETHRLGGAVTVLAPSSVPFIFQPSYTNTTLHVSAVLNGAAGTAADVYCPKGKEPFFLNMVNAGSGYDGRLRVRCGRQSFLDSRPPVTLRLGTAKVGTVEVCAYSMLCPYAGTDKVTVGTLVLADKACLSVGASVNSADDGSVSVTSGGFKVERELSLPAGEGKVLLVLPSEAMFAAPSHRLPLLTAPSGSIDTSKFAIAPFSDGYLPPCRFEIETDGDADTMYVDWNVVLKTATDSGGMDKNTSDSGLNKADCWSDGLLPHGGANYVVRNTADGTINIRMQGSAPYVFPGESLSVFSGSTMYCFITDMTVTNLVLTGGATVKHARNINLYLRGEEIRLTSGEVYFDTYDTHTIRLHAPLSGSGTAVIRGHAVTSSPKGNVRFETANPDFKGAIHLTSQWIKNQGGASRDRVFADEPQWQTLTLASPESLGAPLDEFDPEAMLVDTCGELKIEKSMSFGDRTRGFRFGDFAQITIPSGKTAEFLAQWTLGGELFVRSSGVLALGGEMRFGSGKAISDEPETGKNLLTFPEGGSLKALSRGCIDGATVTFSDGASRLLIAADSEDRDLVANGVRNVKTDQPFVFPGDSLNIEFALNGTQPLSERTRRLGLMTVSSDAAEGLRNRLYVSVPRSVLPKWMTKEIKESVDAETGDVTFWLDVRPVGFQVIVR